MLEALKRGLLATRSMMPHFPHHRVNKTPIGLLHCCSLRGQRPCGVAFKEKSVSCFVRECVWLVQTGPLYCVLCPSFISGTGKVLVTHFMLRCGNKPTALEKKRLYTGAHGTAHMRDQAGFLWTNIESLHRLRLSK